MLRTKHGECWSWIPTPPCGARCAALELEDGIWVAGEAADMLTALRSSPDARIAVALVDSRLAGLQSVALDALRSLARRVRLVVMGTGDAELYAAPYVEAGASGYWAKDGDLTALVAPATGGRRSASGRCG